MGIKEVVEGFIFKIALKKAVKAAGTVIIMAVTAVKVAPVLTQLGVAIDKEQLELGLTALGTAAATGFLNFLKVKTKLGQKYL